MPKLFQDFLSQADNADLFVALGEMTTESFNVTGLNTVAINNAAYTPEICADSVRNRFSKIKSKNFIYLSGTNGNIQKGADILIEAFFELKDQHLYIFSRLEDDVLNFQKTKSASGTASAAQVRQPVYTSSVQRWRRYEKELAPLAKRLTDAGIDIS